MGLAVFSGREIRTLAPMAFRHLIVQIIQKRVDPTGQLSCCCCDDPVGFSTYSYPIVRMVTSYSMVIHFNYTSAIQQLDEAYTTSMVSASNSPSLVRHHMGFVVSHS